MCGAAPLLSRDDQEIKAPLAPLLGASTLVRAILVESNILPCLRGPLVLSFPFAVDVLVNVEEMLKVGETNVKEDCIEDVIEVFDSLGMKAELSQSKSNDEYYEQLVTAAGNEEDIESKIEFKPSCDEENYLSDADENEAKDLSLKQCYLHVDNFECSDQRYWSNIKNFPEENLQNFNICEYSAKYVSDPRKHMRNHTLGKLPMYDLQLFLFRTKSSEKALQNPH